MSDYKFSSDFLNQLANDVEDVWIRTDSMCEKDGKKLAQVIRSLALKKD